MFRTIGGVVLAGLMALSAPPSQAGDGGTVIAAIDLTAPFHTRTPWRFTAIQGPAVADPLMAGDTLPGAISLCLSHDGRTDCDAPLSQVLHTDDATSGPHYLNAAETEYPGGAGKPPVLFLQVAGFPAMNNNRAIVTEALRYDDVQDRFTVAYQHLTGHNNNQETRYIADGPLRGAIISAEPTENAPFGFWITVNRLGPDGAYHADLLYRSATGYNDGNTLAVIDSEMPNIEGRLGLWHSGEPLPVPAGRCPGPHLLRGELWCR